jgi:hypothetical protein
MSVPEKVGCVCVGGVRSTIAMLPRPLTLLLLLRKTPPHPPATRPPRSSCRTRRTWLGARLAACARTPARTHAAHGTAGNFGRTWATTMNIWMTHARTHAHTCGCTHLQREFLRPQERLEQHGTWRGRTQPCLEALHAHAGARKRAVAPSVTKREQDTHPPTHDSNSAHGNDADHAQQSCFRISFKLLQPPLISSTSFFAQHSRTPGRRRPTRQPSSAASGRAAAGLPARPAPPPAPQT